MLWIDGRLAVREGEEERDNEERLFHLLESTSKRKKVESSMFNVKRRLQ